MRTDVVSKIHPEMLRTCYSLRDRVLLALNGTAGGPGRVVVVTSCHRGEGASTVAVSLAAALGMTGRWLVALCDANREAPGIARAIGQEEAPGLTEILAGESDLRKAIRTTSIASLKVLTAGSRKMHLSEMVESSHPDGPFKKLLDALRQEYPFVVFDAPPVLDCSATLNLASMADGTVLVIEAEREPYEVAQMATDLLKSARAKVLGAVLNKRQFHIPGFLYRSM